MRRQKAYFDSTAAQAIANIERNAALGGASEFARALKTASGRYIHQTILWLEIRYDCVDATLIPVLEKIERKNTWRSYSYGGGEKVEFALGMQARALIDRIQRKISSGTAVVSSGTARGEFHIS